MQFLSKGDHTVCKDILSRQDLGTIDHRYVLHKKKRMSRINNLYLNRRRKNFFFPKIFRNNYKFSCSMKRTESQYMNVLIVDSTTIIVFLVNVTQLKNLIDFQLVRMRINVFCNVYYVRKGFFFSTIQREKNH